MTSDSIPKISQTLEERGLPSDSYFEVVFRDGSIISEKEANWSSFTEKTPVDYFGRTFAFYVSKYPIKSIRAVLDGLEAEIEGIPDGVQVYQFMRSQRVLAQNVDKNSVIGRGIGLVKDGVVIEEKFINAYEHKVQGMRK